MSKQSSSEQNESLILIILIFASICFLILDQFLVPVLMIGWLIKGWSLSAAIAGANIAGSGTQRWFFAVAIFLSGFGLLCMA